jgi:hypothetical protein
MLGGAQLLVHPDDLERARELLDSAGMQPHDSGGDDPEDAA